MIGLDICSVKFGLIFSPESVNQLVTERFGDYLYDGPPEFLVKLNWIAPGNQIAAKDEGNERTKGFINNGVYFLRSQFSKGVINPFHREAEITLNSTDPYDDIEYFLRIVTAYGVHLKGGFLFHSAGIVRENKAYLFFGKSGSGKSTVAKYSSRYSILSDDLVGVIPLVNEVMAYSTPFWNPGWAKHAKNQAPVVGFYRLVKSDALFIEPIRESLAISEILSSVPILTTDQKICAELIPVIQSIIPRSGVYYLNFLKDNSFWKILVD